MRIPHSCMCILGGFYDSSPDLTSSPQAGALERGTSLPSRGAALVRRSGENAVAMHRASSSGAPLPGGARRLSGSGSGRWV